MPFLPPGVISCLWVFRAKPAGIEPCLVFLAGLPALMEPAPGLCPVLQQGGMVKCTPPLLAEDQPFRIVRVCAFQVPDAADIPLFNHHTVFYRKTGLFQTMVMVRVTVKAGEKIRMGIFFQHPETLAGETLIIHAAVTRKYRVFPAGKMVLVRDPIGRISQYQGNAPIREPGKQFQTVHAVYLVYRQCLSGVFLSFQK